MNLIYLLLTLSLFVRTAQSEEVDLQVSIAELDKRWPNRDLGDFGKKQYELAKTTAGTFPANYAAQWQYSRAAFWICFQSSSNATREQYCKEGWDAGKQAIALNESGVEGYYWSAVSIGIYANAVGMMDAVRKGLGTEFEENAKKAISLDPSYDGAGPHRILGRFYQNLPWPLADMEKANVHLHKAYGISPGKALNLIYIAEYHIKNEDPEAAKQILEVLLSPDYLVEDKASYRKSKPRAQELLEGI